jgi:hypothetical protein
MGVDGFRPGFDFGEMEEMCVDSHRSVFGFSFYEEYGGGSGTKTIQGQNIIEGMGRMEGMGRIGHEFNSIADICTFPHSPNHFARKKPKSGIV